MRNSARIVHGASARFVAQVVMRALNLFKSASSDFLPPSDDVVQRALSVKNGCVAGRLAR
jgi:hypothetical protein